MTKGFYRNFPPFKILTEEQEDAIHRASLEVLQKTGIRFESQRALKLFEKNGCKVDWELNRVRFPPGLVEECLRRCPSSFTLHARKPENDITLGGNYTYFCSFPGMRTVDLDTWEQRTPTIEDNHNAVKVLDTLDNLHLTVSYVPYCELDGVPPAMLLPTSTWSRMKYMAKPMRIGQAMDSFIFDIQMAQSLGIDVFGSFESAPPLAWWADAIDCAWACCEAGFPIEVGCGGVMGGTAPATLAGGLVTSNAEMMSGIVLVQLLKPGNGCIANCFVFPQQMQNGAPAFGTIGVSLFQMAYNQMWQHRYKLPTLLGACGPVAAKPIDYQNGFEKATLWMTAAMTGATIINSTGGMYGELAYHPVQAIMDNDAAGMVKRLLEGITVNDDTLGLDVIHKVGPMPGFFLGEAHTRKHYKTENYIPKIMDQLTYPEWVKAGHPSALDKAKEKYQEILAGYQDTLPATKHAELDCILAEARKYYASKGLI